MGKVENGLFVSIDYKGTLENGQVFGTSYGRQPLEVNIGSGQMIKGFEKELLGMSLNEKKVFTLDAQSAYGERNENLMQSFAKKEFPPEIDPQVGMMINLRSPEGHPAPARIVRVDDENVTFDLNHPLAGESLTFEVEVVGISSTQTQVSSGCGCGCDCSSSDS